MANPTIQGAFTVMHYSTVANYNEFVYGAYIIIENTSGPFTINGTTITAPVAAQLEGQVVPLFICGDTTVANADLMLLGNPKPEGICMSGDTYSGAVAANINDSTDIIYNFQDIKSGKFNRS